MDFPVPVALTVAGSDPGGGAGVQSDLRTFAIHGLHGCAVVAGLTVQNRAGVHRVRPVPAEWVSGQLDAILEDFPVAAAKTGMLGSESAVDAVARLFGGRRVPLVVDPVLVSSSGARLVSGDGPAAYLRLAPIASLITPNHDEAAALLGTTPARVASDPEGAARALAERGCAVLVTGGHAEGAAVDVLVSAGRVHSLRSERIQAPSSHGTGCLLTAGIVSALARGADLVEAVGHGKRCVEDGLRCATSAGVRLEVAPD